MTNVSIAKCAAVCYDDGVMNEDNELTLDKLQTAMDSIKSVSKMPRWKDLTWAQRNIVEREIAAIEDPFIRRVMWWNYYDEEEK